MKGILIGEVLCCFLGNTVGMASEPMPAGRLRNKQRSICTIERPAGRTNFVFYFSLSGKFLNAWEKLSSESHIVMDHNGLGFDIPEEDPDSDQLEVGILESKCESTCDDYCTFCEALSNAIESQNLAEIQNLVKSDNNVEFLKKSPGVAQWISRRLYEQLKKDQGRSQKFILQVSNLFNRRNTGVDFYLKRLLRRS